MTSEGRRARFPWLASWTPARVFAVLALGFGLPMAFVSPPLTTPDEGRHMARIYTLASGHWSIPEADEARIPRSLLGLNRTIERLWPPFRPRVQRSLDVLDPLWDRPLQPSIEIPVKNLGSYGPVAYAPQALGFAVGRALEVSPIALVHLGRVANLLIWTLVVAAALSLTPFRAWSLAALALLPMSLFLAASLSADAATNALGLFFVAAVLRAAFGPDDRVERRDVVLMGVSVACFGLTKGGYWGLAALALLVPGARFRGVGHRALVLAAVALAALVPSGLWFVTAQATGYTEAGQGADWRAQLGFIAGDPLGYARVFIDSWLQTGRLYAATFLGGLGRLDVQLPGWLYGALFVSLFVVPATEPRGAEGPSACQRAGLVALFALCTAAAFTMIYLSGNEVGAPLIRGVQGRYLLPLAPLLLLAVPSYRRQPERDGPAFPALFAAGVSVASLVALRALWLRYYL